jgi:hypothetical protein
MMEVVEANACLWDKTCGAYKENILKQNLWKEYLFPETDFKIIDGKKQPKQEYALSPLLYNTPLRQFKKARRNGIEWGI